MAQAAYTCVVDTEQWLPVPIAGYEDNYQVSNLGRVWSRPRLGTKGGIKAQWLDGDGYPSVRLSAPGLKHLNRKVAVLVALAFIGPRPDPEAEVCHNDGDKMNSEWANLRFDTPSANLQDMIQHNGGTFNSLKDRCPAGHLYDEENTYRFRKPNGDIGRNCRKCGAINAARYRKAARQRSRPEPVAQAVTDCNDL